eukprot:1161078-Pelagomonas_calceolata.AAC.9
MHTGEPGYQRQLERAAGEQPSYRRATGGGQGAAGGRAGLQPAGSGHSDGGAAGGGCASEWIHEQEVFFTRWCAPVCVTEKQLSIAEAPRPPNSLLPVAQAQGQAEELCDTVL